MITRTLTKIALLSALGLGPAACAQQSGAPANQGMGSMPGMSGMSGMQGHGMAGHDMGGQDMQAMMSQCTDMRRQMAQGTHQNAPDMAQMMAHCDEMDRSMSGMPGMGPASSAPAPAATRSR